MVPKPGLEDEGTKGVLSDGTVICRRDSPLSMFPATAVLFGLCCLLDFLGFVSTSNLVSNFLHWILCIVCKFDFTALSQDPTPNGHSS